MGLFDTHCVESGLALRGAVRLVPIVESVGGFELLAGSIVAEYDGYGGADLRRADAASRALAAELGRWCVPLRLPGSDGRPVWRALAAEQTSVRHEGRLVTYSLFDARVAEVMDAAVSPVLVERVAHQDALGRPRTERDRRFLASVAARRTHLRPVWQTFGGQYRPADAARFIGAARDRYGAEPEMLAAIDENARRWAE